MPKSKVFQECYACKKVFEINKEGFLCGSYQLQGFSILKAWCSQRCFEKAHFEKYIKPYIKKVNVKNG